MLHDLVDGADRLVLPGWLNAVRGELGLVDAQGLGGHLVEQVPDVDDIAQASFVAAYSRLEEYTAGTNFAAWLFTIARYQLQTETTRLRRIADYHSRYAPDLLACELERRTAAPAGEQDDRLGFLKDCLEALDATRRQVLVWRYDDAIPLAEMAARSGRSVMAVKKQLWLLRRQLQECVEGKVAAADAS